MSRRSIPTWSLIALLVPASVWGQQFEWFFQCALFWKRTTRGGAIAGMVAGFAGTVGWVLLFKERWWDLYEMIPGFALGFAASVGVSLVTRPPEGAAEEFDGVWRVVGRPFGPGREKPER